MSREVGFREIRLVGVLLVPPAEITGMIPVVTVMPLCWDVPHYWVAGGLPYERLLLMSSQLVIVHGEQLSTCPQSLTPVSAMRYAVWASLRARISP